LKRISDRRRRISPAAARPAQRGEESKLVRQFQEQTANHYQEIIENCEVNFTKEIEFEIFRKNFTYEEAEEIRLEFEKIRAWFDRVSQRDWFGASSRDEAQEWIGRCGLMLEEFEARVFEVQEHAAGHLSRKSPRRGSADSAPRSPKTVGLPAGGSSPATGKRRAKILPMRITAGMDRSAQRLVAKSNQVVQK